MQTEDKTPETKTKRGQLWKLAVGGGLSLVVVGAGLAFFGMEKYGVPEAVHGSDAALSIQVAALEARVKLLEKKTSEATPTVVSAAAPGAEASPDLTEVKEKIAALENRADGQTRAVAALRASLAAAVLSGAPYEPVLKITKAALPEREAVLDKFESAAKSGLPSYEKMTAAFTAKRGVVEKVLREKAAQTWQDRVVAAVQGLVVVRSVADDAKDEKGMAGIVRALEKSKGEAALEKIRALPEEAQAVIAVETHQLEMHLGIETALKNLAEQETSATPSGETP